MEPTQNLPPSDNNPPGPDKNSSAPSELAFSAPKPTTPPTPTSPSPAPSPQPTQNQVPSMPQGPVIYGAGSTPVVSNISHKSRRKRLLVVGLIALVLLLLGGFVFGYYLPNKPDNAYKTGINRTGYALDKMINGATEKSSLDALKKSDITLGIEAKYNDATYAGNFNVKFDTSKANAGINFTSAGGDQSNQTFNAKIMGEIPSGSQYPNVYVQLNGLKDLGIDSFVPGASKYDGKWIAILSDYLKSLGNVPTAEEASKKNLTSDDIAELAKAATSATRDYVFSTDPTRAVFEKKAFVGKEKVDGVTAFHYQVGLNKEHLTAYCKAAIDKIYSTNAYKKLPWVNENNVDKDKENNKKDCESSSSDVNTKDTYDLWVEAKYKLIYKYRVTDGENKEAYTEVGQIYKGGSKFTFFANYHDGKSKMDGKLTLDMDFKSNTTTGTLTFTGGETDSTYSLKITLDAKPYTGEIKVEKPENAVPVEDVLKTFGIDPHEFFGALDFASANTQKSNNTERQTDIKILHGQVEAYYAQNGHYPTLTELNNPSWRATYMKGIDKEAFRDPSGTGYVLVAKPATNIYAYDVSAEDGSACNNTTKDCTKYILTTTYEDGNGATFVKTNLN